MLIRGFNRYGELTHSNQEKEFLSTYHTFGENGSSAILPSSARKLFADAEGYLVYSVVALKKFVPFIQQVCRENRYTFRTFSLEEMDNSKSEDTDEYQLIQLEAEEKKIKAELLQWCVPSYSELASEWVHLKGLRVYIESILRYGLHTATFSFIVFVCFVVMLVSCLAHCKNRLKVTRCFEKVLLCVGCDV